MKKSIGALIIQIIPVMVGVFLGFLASNWAEKNQRKEQSDVFIKNLLSEIESNEKRLKGVMDYHLMVRDSSRFYTDPQNEIAQTNYFKGTRILKLTNSAYNTGIQTGAINELSVDDIQAINQLYTFQNDYNEFGNLMMASLINRDFSNDSEDLRKIARFLALTMTDIVIKENDLIADYDRIKSRLRE